MDLEDNSHCSSVPFWSFSFLALVFGVLGTVLAASPAIVPVAVLAGLGMGWGAGHLLRLIGRRNVNSLVRTEDLVGLEGRVTLEIGSDNRGFVELTARGSLIRRPARSPHGTIPENTRVVIVNCDDHTLTVEPL